METYEIFDKDIFGNNMDHAIAVMWWLVYLSGGKVVFPLDESFWDENYPEGTRLVLRKEEGKLVLVSEVSTFQQHQPEVME